MFEPRSPAPATTPVTVPTGTAGRAPPGRGQWCQEVGDGLRSIVDRPLTPSLESDTGSWMAHDSRLDVIGGPLPKK